MPTSSPSASRVVLVTGASQGIGKAAAERFAAAGDRLVITDLTDGVIPVAEDISRRWPAAAPVAVVSDITDPSACDHLVATCKDTHAGMDVLVHATATKVPRGPAIDLDPGDWDRVMTMNAKGPFLLCRSAVPAMPRGGRIVFTGSFTGQVGIEGGAVYSASKGALRSFTHSLALELADKGITVNGVAPAHVEAALNRKSLEEAAARTGRPVEELARERDADIPLGRQATTAEIADAMFFLASSTSSYITGTWLDINGGVVLR